MNDYLFSKELKRRVSGNEEGFVSGLFVRMGRTHEREGGNMGKIVGFLFKN